MTIAQVVNWMLLVWGCLFCLVAALSFWNAKNYDAEKRRWMIVMQLTASAMLLSDAAASLVDGTPGRAGWWLVRISNFALFLLTDATMLAFTRYLCVCLLTPEECRSLKRVQVARAVGWIGVGLVVLNLFTGLYYRFDAANVYHRSGWYWISLTIPVGCMLADSSLLLQYRQRVSQKQQIAMGSYILLPLIGSLIQTLHYGWSLISLSVGVSMILMFLVSTSEQDEELRKLAVSRAQIEEKLEIATMLNRCVAKLSDGTDRNAALHNLMEVVRDYFQADRCYLFKILPEHKTVINTYEVVREGVTPQIDNLQEVPLEAIDHWMERFRQEQVYYMDKLEQEKGFASYEMLKAQNVWRLLTVPLCRGKQIIGFMGLDNPRRHAQDATLLSSIQFFIVNSLDQRDQQEYLRQLSYHDQLTHLQNRNSYMEKLHAWQQEAPEQVGGIYADLNGLKQTNDTQGHEAGDALICSMAEALERVFPQQAYRMGGDEFVVLLRGIPQDSFEEKVQQLRRELLQRQVSAAVGAVWQQAPADLEALMREADDRMYREKEIMKRK